MFTLGSLGIAAPWMLLGLLVLPVIWWLLRVTPPAPRRVVFPAIRLLFGLNKTDESSARTPWWLMALRLLIAALVIVALAEPILNPGSRLRGDGSLYNRMDSFLESGISPEDCARRVLNAIHGRKREVLIADGVARRNVLLKRWSPALLSWVTRRRKPGRTTVPAGGST